MKISGLVLNQDSPTWLGLVDSPGGERTFLWKEDGTAPSWAPWAWSEPSTSLFGTGEGKRCATGFTALLIFWCPSVLNCKNLLTRCVNAELSDDLIEPNLHVWVTVWCGMGDRFVCQVTASQGRAVLGDFNYRMFPLFYSGWMPPGRPMALQPGFVEVLLDLRDEGEEVLD